MSHHEHTTTKKKKQQPTQQLVRLSLTLPGVERLIWYLRALSIIFKADISTAL